MDYCLLFKFLSGISINYQSISNTTNMFAVSKQQLCPHMCGSEPLHHLQSVHHAPHVLPEPPQGHDDLLLELRIVQPFNAPF